MGADFSERQIALARGIYIAKNQTAKDEVIARRTKTRGLVDALAETPGDVGALHTLSRKFISA